MPDKSTTVTNSMEETKDRHRRYLRAINNPIRRNILRAIYEGNDTISSINEAIQIDEKTLDWHLKILIDGFCIEKKLGEDHERYILTKEASVVDYLDK
ncbi:ArsR family transcriptional regulator [Candidatus Bathyarchaeota archaeon]|nr:winged helix-turn-helix transcriptional regulator [Candidatus Bathyarchaeota archaeon]TFH15507.1 MAG: ArsR family transcriptional regulator [Candidatus Bathyarchaeota archaeon]